MGLRHSGSRVTGQPQASRALLGKMPGRRESCLERRKGSTQARKAGPAGARATAAHTESGVNVSKLKITIRVQNYGEYVALR